MADSTASGDHDYETRLKSFIGREVGEPQYGPDAVNEPMIRHWCEAMGDTNPTYTDPEAAADSVHGGIVAPPTMLQAWVMPGLRSQGRDPDDVYDQLTELLYEGGYTSVLATDCTQTYERYLRPGDRLTMRTTIDDVSPEKTTALGTGRFVTTRQDYYAGDELVGSMQFRILRFRPAAKQATSAPDAGRPLRPRPATTVDNKWWFDALARGELRVQRCDSCGAVRHPPGPMCPRCRSIDWSLVEAGPSGTIHSFVRVHHPKVPSFDYPLGVLLVDVDVPKTGDTVRILMNPVDGDAPLAIDTPVRVEVRQVDDDLALPFAAIATGTGDTKAD